MNILKKIYRVFPEINWTTLNRTHYPRIRFYFDFKDISLEEEIILLNNIFNYIFENDNIYCCLTLFWDNKISKNTLKAINSKWLDNIVNLWTEINILNIDDIKYFQFFSKISYQDVIKINNSIIGHDLWIEPILDLKCYYFSFWKKLAINLYDDRWMDIISTNIEMLKEIKNKFWKIVKIKIEQE